VRDLTPPELRGQVERHLRGMGERYAAAFSADQIALHIACAYVARQKGLATRHSPNEETNQTELVICAEDRPALFATLAGCFAAQLLDVNGAAVFTTPDGLALDCFSISDPKRRRPLTPNEVEGLRRVLRSVLFDGRDVQGLVDDSRKRLFALLQPRAHTGRRVDFDNQASRTHTIIDIEAGDRTGLLYDMTRAMAEAGLDIFAARITTDARRVRDSFYVRKGKRKIVSPDEQARIRQGILKAIEPPAPPNVKGEYA
jgi:[protein-PII] uridylyltransferase